MVTTLTRSPKEFIVKDLDGSRKKLWTKLNRNRLFGVEDQNIKAESMRQQTDEQLSEAEHG